MIASLALIFVLLFSLASPAETLKPKTKRARKAAVTKDVEPSPISTLRVTGAVIGSFTLRRILVGRVNETLAGVDLGA